MHIYQPPSAGSGEFYLTEAANISLKDASSNAQRRRSMLRCPSGSSASIDLRGLRVVCYLGESDQTSRPIGSR